MSASEASIDAAMLDPAGLSEEDMAALIASADTGQEIPQDVEGATSGAGENEKGTQDEPIESADPEARAKEEGKEPKQPEAKPDATPQATDERGHSSVTRSNDGRTPHGSKRRTNRANANFWSANSANYRSAPRQRSRARSPTPTPRQRTRS